MTPLLKTLPTVALAAAVFTQTAKAENFIELWQVGVENNSQSDFGQEGGGANALPGSSANRDDDYYFGGVYPEPIGIVAADEPFVNFERALLVGDPRVRIHFNLDELNTDPEARMRLVVDLCCNDHGADFGNVTTGPISFAGLFNGTEILTGVTSGVNGEELVVTSDAFTAADVSAVTGENIITIERPTEGGGNWMQFDYVRLEVDTDSLGCPDPICSFGAGRRLINPGESVNLSWITDATATLEIDQGVGNVDAVTSGGAGTIAVSPTQNTTYTLTSTRGEDVETASVTIIVDIIQSFTSSDVEVTPGSTTTLSWVASAAASLSIDQGVGNVDAVTTNGMGSIQVIPEAPSSTYTLTATNGPDVETATVTVGANNFADLWQVGIADNSSADFVQEDFAINDPPGSPTTRDDDWYFAGVYPDPIGIVSVNEDLTSLEEVNPRTGFERALLVFDPTNRIHFNLDEANASSGTNMRLTVATVGSNIAEFSGFSGPIPFTASYNGNEILSETVVGAELALNQGVFNAGDVGATTGENVIEITRATDAGGSWILFDYIKLETEPSLGPEFKITAISVDDATGNVSVTWNSKIDQSYVIETSTDLAIASGGEWTEFTDNFTATSESSTETIMAGTISLPAGTTRFFVRIRIP